MIKLDVKIEADTLEGFKKAVENLVHTVDSFHEDDGLMRLHFKSVDESKVGDTWRYDFLSLDP